MLHLNYVGFLFCFCVLITSFTGIAYLVCRMMLWSVTFVKTLDLNNAKLMLCPLWCVLHGHCCILWRLAAWYIYTKL